LRQGLLGYGAWRQVIVVEVKRIVIHLNVLSTRVNARSSKLGRYHRVWVALILNDPRL